MLILNLLIALISDIFNRVKETETETVFKQLAAQICVCQRTLLF